MDKIKSVFEWLKKGFWIIIAGIVIAAVVVKGIFMSESISRAQKKQEAQLALDAEQKLKEKTANIELIEKEKLKNIELENSLELSRIEEEKKKQRDKLVASDNETLKKELAAKLGLKEKKKRKTV